MEPLSCRSFTNVYTSIQRCDFTLLQFVGDGYAGLLVYTLSLQAQHKNIKLERDLMEMENSNFKYTVKKYAQKLCTTNKIIVELQKKKNSALRIKQTTLGYHGRRRRCEQSNK